MPTNPRSYDALATRLTAIRRDLDDLILRMCEADQHAPIQWPGSLHLQRLILSLRDNFHTLTLMISDAHDRAGKESYGQEHHTE